MKPQGSEEKAVEIVEIEDSPVMAELHIVISDYLAEIQRLFVPGCTLTLVMCNPHSPDGDLVIGNHSSVDRVIEVLKKFEGVSEPSNTRVDENLNAK